MKVFRRFFGGVALIVGAVGAGAGVALIPIASSPAGATTTFVVNDANDGTATPGNCTTSTATTGPDCTLRAALLEAADTGGAVVVSLPDPSTVEFHQASVYQVLSMLTVTASSGGSVTVSGVGAATSVLEAQCIASPGCAVTFGVFEISTGTTATISDVEIENGIASTGSQSGGGIWNNGGTLTLQSSTLTSDVANGGSGGGIWNEGTTTITNSTFTQDSTGNIGGAIWNEGTLTATNSTFVDNQAGGRGGALDQEEAPLATMTLTNDVVSDNAANNGDGGGIYVDGGSVTLSGGTVGGTGATSPADLGNHSVTCGGGLAIVDASGTSSGVTYGGTDATAANTANSCGGGVYLSGGTTTFTDDSISDNASIGSGGGGGVYIQSGTNSFTGASVTGNTADNSWNGGGFHIIGGTNTFDDDNVDNNVATSDGWGGGFFTGGGTQTFNGGTLSDNQSYYGGGIFISSGTTTMTQLTVAGNTASEAGGGIVVNDDDTSITTTITDSTISGNTAAGTVGFTAFLGDGGGILDSLCNTLVLTNDTIVDNVAGGSGRGGGYEGEGCGTAGSPNTAFLFDTVANNSTGKSTGGGNIQLSDSSTVTLEDTIVSGGMVGGNPGANCAIDSGQTATFTSLGYNLIGDSTCGTAAATDMIGQNPQLGPLANNGGPTETLLPADSAPEVGAVPHAACAATGVASDQRGSARGVGVGSSCTVGSVEVNQNFNGYRLVAADGGIFDFGTQFSGSLANAHLAAPIVGLANAPGPAGYLLVGSDGGVFALGGANYYGSLGGQAIPSPIAAIAAQPAENGYWLAAQNGKIYNFGAAPALPAVQLPAGAHIVGMASTTDGAGAWLTDQFGNVYAEGTAKNVGGLGAVHLAKPIVGIAAAASGQGYVLVASDGGVFAFGTQGFFGSVPGTLKGQSLAAPIVGIAVTHSGKGYWAVGADGGVFCYGDAPFLGSMGGIRLNQPIVGIQHLGSLGAPI